MTAPKVRVHKPGAAGPAATATPSEELVAKALAGETVTDERGRKFFMRKPGPLAQFRMIEALGELAANQTYMQMVNPLLYLGSIDGDVVVQPQNKLEVEALIQRLDDEGLAAVMGWYVANVLGPTHAKVEAAVRAAEDKALLKN